eukprot:scaffold10316_cov71-Cyclotella_meneghiniana.AAC.1
MAKQIDHTGLSPSCAIDLCSSQSSHGSAITPHAPPRQPANITTVAPAAPACDQSNVDDKQALPSTRLFTDQDGYGYATKDSGSVDVDDDDDKVGNEVIGGANVVGGVANDDDDDDVAGGVNSGTDDDDDEVGGVNGGADDNNHIRFQSIPYQSGVKDSFVDNINKIIAWVNNTCPSNPRLPRQTKDSSEEEKSVYRIIVNLRSKKNKNQVEEYLLASLPIDIFAQGNEARWNAFFTKLRQFQVTNGHLNVDQYDPVLLPLYLWLKRQMNNFDSLDDTKKSLLQSLHSWEERRAMFLNRVTARNEFKETDLTEDERRDTRRRQKIIERTKLLYQQALERVFYDPSDDTTPSLYFKICDSNILDKSEEARAVEEYRNDSSVKLNRTDFTKEDFNELKSDPDFVFLAHFSMRLVDYFQHHQGRLMHISYDSQSLENQRELYHDHDGDTSKVWASADSEFTPPFAARHWKTQAKRWIESAPIVGSKRQVVGDLLCYFPGSEDFYSYSQTKYGSNEKIAKNCRLLASSPNPTSPSAVLRCTWDLPLSFSDFKPEMVALSKTTNKRWVRIDDDFETVVDLPFEEPNLVSMCSGVYTEEYFHAIVLPKLGTTSASNAPNATLRSNKTTSNLKTNSKQQSSKKSHLKQTTLSFAAKSTNAPESEDDESINIKGRIKKAWDEVKHEYSVGTTMVFETFLCKRYSTELISPLELNIDSHQSVLMEWVLSREGEAGTLPKYLVKVKSTENEGIPREGQLYCFRATDLVKSFAPKNGDNDDSEDDDKVATSSKMSTTKRPVACDDAQSDDDVVFVGTSQAQSGHASSRITRVVAKKAKYNFDDADIESDSSSVSEYSG